MNRVLFFSVTLVSMSIMAMQQPARVYNQKKTSELKALLIQDSAHDAPPEQIVKQFIFEGADPNIEADSGVHEGANWLNALLIGVRDKSKEELISFLIQNGANPNRGKIMKPLHMACMNGQFEIVKQLIAKGAQIGAITETGQTPLLLAVGRNCYAIVQFLLQNGAASTMHLSAHGQTPLSLARRDGLSDIVALLEQHKDKK